MIDRVERAGYKTLVITADVPVVGSRENLVRAGFTLPLRPTPTLAWEGISHPRWLFSVLLKTLLKHGMPYFENSDHNRGSAVISSSANRDFTGQDKLDWSHIRHIRDRWKGRLVLKGLLLPEDVKNARDQGADAVIVSNHGGRLQPWRTPAGLCRQRHRHAARSGRSRRPHARAGGWRLSPRHRRDQGLGAGRQIRFRRSAIQLCVGAGR
jgi:isopentenyl diphosphate isomerase/L-lactate dehydrogenase-like FMN-dependent dehydrogenase